MSTNYTQAYTSNMCQTAINPGIPQQCSTPLMYFQQPFVNATSIPEINQYQSTVYAGNVMIGSQQQPSPVVPLWQPYLDTGAGVYIFS